MRVNKFLFVCIFSFVSFLPHVTDAASVTQVYTYQEKVGDKIIPFYWHTEQEDDQISVLVYEKEKSFVNVCRADGSTQQWRFTHKNRHDISASRQGNIIQLSGTIEGEPLERTYEIDDRPWFQPLSFSLRGFLDSAEKKVSFWTIRVDSLKPVALVARKLGDEEVTLQGETVAAQKVELRAEGFYSPFWHADYWFRKKDNIFLMYRGVHGLPGTEETVVTLVGPSEQNG